LNLVLERNALRPPYSLGITANFSPRNRHSIPIGESSSIKLQTRQREDWVKIINLKEVVNHANALLALIN